MKKILLALVLTLIPAQALASGTLYRGSLEVPSTGTITLDAGGSGCGVFVAGVLSNAACPSGTATFLGGTNITVTGSNPYTINCPNCFNITQPNTITGITLFNAQATFTNSTQFNGGIISASSSIPVTIGNTNTFSSGGIQMGTTGGFGIWNTTGSSIATCNIVGNEMALTAPNSGPLVVTIDQSGNLCSAGTIYYVSSKSTKQDIHQAAFDPLSVLADADFNLLWRYKPGVGNPNQWHYGPMADDLPSYISGENHGRIDLQALVNTEGAAINELATRMRFAYGVICGLIIWCALLSIAVVREK